MKRSAANNASTQPRLYNSTMVNVAAWLSW